MTYVVLFFLFMVEPVIVRRCNRCEKVLTGERWLLGSLVCEKCFNHFLDGLMRTLARVGRELTSGSSNEEDTLGW